MNYESGVRRKRSGVKIKFPEKREVLFNLKAGDKVYLSGIIYTARDEVHRRIADCGMKNGIRDSRFEIRDSRFGIRDCKKLTFPKSEIRNPKSEIENPKSEIRNPKFLNLPFDVKNQIIYYTGPTPAKPGEIIGSCGPTTSARMDAWTPSLLSLGLAGMIGKGPRSIEVINAIKKYQAVYFVAIGGAAAYYTNFITKAEIIAYPELGCEAIHKLEVKDFPLYVGIDKNGENIIMECK